MESRRNLKRKFKFSLGYAKKVKKQTISKVNVKPHLKWYNKCVNANVYPDGAMHPEDASLINEQLINKDLKHLTAPNGWLEKWKFLLV